MKRLILFFIVFTATTTFSQKKIHLHVGNTHQNVFGFELLPDSLNEATYYHIVNGYFDYYYVNKFDGKYIQFDHLYCDVRKLDFKSYAYRTYKGYTVLTIKTINEELEVMVNSWTVDGTETSKAEFASNQIELFIPNEEIGKTILKQIKKGADL